MIYLAYTIHVLICLFLILVVLLQQGKGADLSVFGGGGTMTAFGARGAATLLHKMTVFAVVGFIVPTMVIGVLQGQREGSSVMSGVETPVEEEAAPAEEATEEPAAALPEEEPAGVLPEAEEFDAGAAAEIGPVEEEAPAADQENGGGSDQP